MMFRLFCRKEQELILNLTYKLPKTPVHSPQPQQRQFLRLMTPVAQPARCALVCEETVLDVPVCDIGGGGLGLMATQTQVWAFLRQKRFEQATLSLPGEGRFRVDLRVRNTFSINTRTGQRYLRVGCAFDRLDAATAAGIERYLAQLQQGRAAA
jgi:c-di-GMP-binding flagellar brake protein YcgR